MAPRTTRFLLPPKRTSSVCNDQRPGIVRERTDKGFVYRDSAGATITDRDELARIKLHEGSDS